MSTFIDLGLEPKILEALEEMGFEETTPIQEKTIPPALKGEDLIGQAQTGTGKTAAYGIPLIAKLAQDEENVRALILAPTRELAVQVAEELRKIGRLKGVRTLAIYGGQDISRQIKSLKKRPQIIVATPGRLMDHMKRRTIRLESVNTVILDEADEMLNMGFVEDIEEILKEVPEDRQTLLFSATMPKAIRDLSKKFMKEPQLYAVKAQELTVPNINQQYIEIHEKGKFDLLCRLLDIHHPELAIIFGRTKRRVDELSDALIKMGYRAEGLHGDLVQAKRDRVLNKFKEGYIEILVATDVAARGLDISGVTHVYNFDLPQDPESYVHRIGRTGRAGNKGLAMSFVTPRERGHLKTIENLTKKELERMPLPTLKDAKDGRAKMAKNQLLDGLKDKRNVKNYRDVSQELLEEYPAEELVAAALSLLTKEEKDAVIKLTSEPPVRVKNDRGRSNNNNNRRRNYRSNNGRRKSNNEKSSNSGNKGNYKNKNKDNRNKDSRNKDNRKNDNKNKQNNRKFDDKRRKNKKPKNK